MLVKETIFHTVLIGCSTYTLCRTDPQTCPYAFAAGAIGIIHGVVGLVQSISEKEDGTAHQCTLGTMEVVPLPLINIDVYKHHGQAHLALGHGAFIIPYAIYIIMKHVGDGEADSANFETVKDLTILGNVVSLLFAALNEGNWVLGGMAFLGWFARFGASMIEQVQEGSYEPTLEACYSIIYVLMREIVCGGHE